MRLLEHPWAVLALCRPCELRMRLLVHLQAVLALSRPYALELALCRPLLLLLRVLALCRPLLRAALIL